MNTNRQLPFDVDDPEVQRACRAVARLLLGDAGEEEARRTMLAVMIAATQTFTPAGISSSPVSSAPEPVTLTPAWDCVPCRDHLRRRSIPTHASVVRPTR